MNDVSSVPPSDGPCPKFLNPVGRIQNQVAGSKLSYRTAYLREERHGNITIKVSPKHQAHVPCQPRSQSQAEGWRLGAGRVYSGKIVTAKCESLFGGNIYIVAGKSSGGGILIASPA